MYKVIFERRDDSIRCKICERRCSLKDGMIGICKNYKNEKGELKPTAYGLISALEPRPIEIKPLFHYWPGSWALTFSGYGCNLYCPWCQNWELSFSAPKMGRMIKPEEMVEIAVRRKMNGFSASFNEPTIHFSYLIDLFKLAKERGLYSMMVTNGTFTREALLELMEAGADGFAVDIKTCPDNKRFLKYYDPVKVIDRCADILKRDGHVELIYLVVPKFNDDTACVEWFLNEVANKLGLEIPIHFNRYYPAYRYDEPPTSRLVLIDIKEKAEKMGFNFVYVGNIGDTKMETTYCPKCRKALLVRGGGYLIYSRLDERNRCPNCNTLIPIKGKVVQRSYLDYL